MRAICLEGYGGPEVLQYREVPEPQAGVGQVVIAVAATAVNRADTSQRRGNYPPPDGAPPYPGLECSGTITAVGHGVKTWKPGDEVCALLGGGGYAEQVAVEATHLLPRPAGLSLIEAAALPEAACTIAANLGGSRAPESGQSILIHGGSSGIGTLAISWMRARGVRVLTTVGSAVKAAACRELGAELAVDYTTEDFVDAVSQYTDGAGVDVILDIVGAAYLRRNLSALAPQGRLVVIGIQSGAEGELDLRLLLQRRATITGSTLRSRSSQEKASIVELVTRELWPLIEDGTVRPSIDRLLPLSEAAQAHRILESSEHIGKIVLTTG